MKHIFYIFTFLLLVIPTSEAYSCGNSSKKFETKLNCCGHSDKDTEKKSCCDSKDDNGCNGNCNNSSCHCPSSVNIQIPASLLEYSLSINLSLLTINWSYVQNAPKPVYVSIWQPPKTS